MQLKRTATLESKVPVCSYVFVRMVDGNCCLRFTFWLLCSQEGKFLVPANRVFLPPPEHHPLLDELLKLFSGSFQMSRTKPYIVTMTATSRSFPGNEEPLKGIAFISENNRSRFDTGHLKRSANGMSWAFRRAHGMLGPSPPSQAYVSNCRCHGFLD